MANGSTFTSVWARCKEHGKLLEPYQEMCDECRILQRNLSLTPPFDIYCIDDYFVKFKKGKRYEVVWVIKEASNRLHTSVKGYCVANDDDSIYEYILDPLKFIPVQFLTKDDKDSWLENA